MHRTGRYQRYAVAQKAKFCLVDTTHAYTYLYTPTSLLRKSSNEIVIWFTSMVISHHIQVLRVSMIQYPPTRSMEAGGSAPAKVNSADARVV